MGLRQRLMRVGANAHAVLFRRFRPARSAAGLPVLLLTVAGRRSGRLITTPVAYVEHAGGLAVVGTFVDGREPQWFRNLRATGTATIELGDETRAVAARFAGEAETAAVWARFVAGATIPVSTTHRATGRSIAVLTPPG